ncbi:hypothetical protein P9112_001561 [Eukaryota sp. TZLM1-RC]
MDHADDEVVTVSSESPTLTTSADAFPAPITPQDTRRPPAVLPSPPDIPRQRGSRPGKRPEHSMRGGSLPQSFSPAADVQCNFCKQMRHPTKRCPSEDCQRSKKWREQQAQQQARGRSSRGSGFRSRRAEYDYDTIFMVQSMKFTPKCLQLNFLINNVEVKGIVDSGATCSVVTEDVISNCNMACTNKTMSYKIVDETTSQSLGTVHNPFFGPRFENELGIWVTPSIVPYLPFERNAPEDSRTDLEPSFEHRPGVRYMRTTRGGVFRRFAENEDNLFINEANPCPYSRCSPG